MKSVLTNTVFATLVAVLALSFSGNAMANDGGGKEGSVSEFKFIGNMESFPVFQLNLTNDEVDEFCITITDQSGNILYSDRVKGSNITKKFAINRDEISDNTTLRLEVKSKSGNKKEVYTFNKAQNYVVEGSITKVK